MLWEDDLDIFKAMCDAGNVSRYTDNTVESIFTAMINKRSPNGKPSANDLPFTGTPGQTSNDSIKNSFLRARTGESPTSTRLFELTNQSHPYRKYELMTRLKNLTTNRSNVFAVWVTVGFFEVKDETTRPMKLGAEIGLQEGRNIRHRMFAIVDRTQIGALNADLGATLSGNVSSTGFQPLQMSKTSGTVQPIDNSNLGTASGKYQWTLHEGMSLVIDKGGQNEEQVIALKDANTGSFFAYFTKTHNSGESLSLPGTPGPVNGSVLGHPGPQPGFDVRNNPRVVPFFTVIN